ncbi:FGGY family carbohydrate kinase [Mucilaginibacter pocheonensis]|uniref:ATP:glycerol 3-phosphotransferase n=1 Tax=Mucilaginibacter pocheonensis TaxID=398050 RepID=A0ABU1T6V0_9SPHI|nr:glycerol kinase GlpK [Mucilaginibacter pocheonensis]MDR6941029.1 glycerol kinase [Mucilaginibacter pocheonensis]
MTNSYILAVDQGTSSTKCIIFDGLGKIVAKATEPLKTHYMEGGFVEQDPFAIYQNVLDAVKKCRDTFTLAGGNLADIRCCGISNQRETFVVWDKSGTPLHNAVVWQCKRSVTVCQQLKARGLEQLIKERTGLIIDPYFSGTKLIWLYENNTPVKQAIENGEAYFGTVDTWLLYKLTNGKTYLTDHTNASRTLFFNLKTLTWDNDILNAFGLSGLNLPQIKPSSSFYGTSDFGGLFETPLDITAMIGDSHAAAFGEGCFEAGTAKATLGTGCSILMNIGSKVTDSANGMVTTICWSTEERVDYALEGVIVSCGATIEWLKNELGLFTESKQTELMASDVPHNNGVYLIPAFSGLGAPYWDMNRKAEIIGLTFDCNKNHIVRAALESIAFQIKDVITAMETDTGIPLVKLMVNGGITANHFVLQLIADVLRCELIKQDMPDISALGAAYLAGLQTGIFKTLADISSLKNAPVSFVQTATENNMQQYHSEWLSYIKKLR